MSQRSPDYKEPKRPRTKSQATADDLKIELVPIGLIRPHPKNAREHSAQQIGHLTAIIRQVGFVQPVLLDQDNFLVAGHARWEAAKQLGFSSLPTIRLPARLTDAELRALRLADNRIAELATWDEAALKIELTELVLLDTPFSIPDITGFAPPVLDAIIHAGDFATPDLADSVLPALAETAIARVGDVFSIGPHRIVCGDARDDAVLALLLGNERARQILTDIPYNVPIHGHVSGKGRVKHREFPTASGEMSIEAFCGFNVAWLTAATTVCSDGALVYVFIGGLQIGELIEAGRKAGLALIALCVWAKTNSGMGSLYRSQIEHVAVFKFGKGKHVNNVQLGRHGRNRSNLWSYPGMNAFGKGRDAAIQMHPTVKPVGLLTEAILDASARGDIILDPFLGSGSTLIAAHRTGRHGYGVELDPLYVDAALDRLAAVLKIDPVRRSDGVSWAELTRQRREGDGQ